MLKPMLWKGDHFLLLDQLKLPMQENWVRIETYEEGARAIADMIVRGAPAIGITAAYAYALGFQSQGFSLVRSDEIVKTLVSTRPTAVNLRWALDRMQSFAKTLANDMEKHEAFKALSDEAVRIHEEDIEMNLALGRHSLEVLSPGTRVLTHCNAGALATGGYGTALGVIRAGHERGLVENVWVDETRPFLQGARLTAYELEQEKIPYTLICDNMAGSLMRAKKVDLVVVGADRIVKNGDVANKIGTYSLAALCSLHQIPFYVAAPSSTLDLNLDSGDLIEIEERNPDELGIFSGVQITKNLEAIFNPGFDVTPHSLITGIITEKGVLSPPFKL
jgi:methylthioribose-1-phosphate isomerase